MDDGFKKCCFTGYRPQKFPFDISKKNPEYIKMENALTDVIFSLPEDDCFTFYSGMAMGFDIIAAETVLLLRRAYEKASIKLICAVPFIDQPSAFDEEWKKRYNDVLSQADEVILISDKYYPGCYAKRNEFMVRYSDYVVTWFDGRSGGTKNTVKFAEKLGRKVINLYDGK